MGLQLCFLCGPCRGKVLGEGVPHILEDANNFTRHSAVCSCEWRLDERCNRALLLGFHEGGGSKQGLLHGGAQIDKSCALVLQECTTKASHGHLVVGSGTLHGLVSTNLRKRLDRQLHLVDCGNQVLFLGNKVLVFLVT